jgi:hypothetical protein
MASARYAPAVHHSEEAGEPQVGDDDHHSEQKRDSIEIDRTIGLVE